MNKPIDYLSMSDDQIANMTAPAPGEAEVVADKDPNEQQEEPQQTPEEIEAARVAAEQADNEKAEADKAAQEAADALAAEKGNEGEENQEEKILGAADDAKVDSLVPPEKKPEEKVTPKVEPTEAEKAAQAEKDRLAAEEVAKNAPKPMSVEEKAAALDSMMTFKANGKEIKLNSPEELVKLAQMGANYTKKMQQLQPQMRLIKMLDNNKLTDPDELAYLIDLHQKRPEAIQKLLADSKFDPMTVDVEKAAQYKPGAHQVTDTELKFEQVLQEVEASDTGPELISEVAKQWDDGSRRALYQQPRLLAELNSQKHLGIYGKISSEIERRKMLGELQDVPFLVAYEAIGKELHANGMLVPPTQNPPAKTEEPPKREPAAVRTVTPPAKVVNNDKAKSASAPKTTPASAKVDPPNYLEMPDSEFVKQFEGRL